MKLSRLAMLVAAFAAWFGSSLGVQTVTAADTPKAAAAVDIVLTEKGTLSGILVDAQGKPLPAKKVVLSQGKKELATATTDTKGKFELKTEKSGVYQVSSGNQGALVRAWSAETAPNSAKKQALLVSGGQRVVRAQAGMDPAGALGVVGLAAGGAGLGLAISNANEVNDLEKQLAQQQNSP